MSDLAPRRLLVVWTAQQPRIQIHGVGCLRATGCGYAFEYLPHAKELDNFAPFSSFPDFDRPYASTQLFPFFAARVIARQRDDYSATCRALGLDPQTADPLQLLDRTGGTRKGDRVGVVGEPLVAPDGSTEHAFLVKGLRFALPDAEVRESALTGMREGEALAITRDEGNAVNPEARLVVRQDGTALGWIPDALIAYVDRVLKGPRGLLRVDRLNSPDQPPHLRLLVRLTGVHEPELPPLPQLPRRLTESVGCSS